MSGISGGEVGESSEMPVRDDDEQSNSNQSDGPVVVTQSPSPVPPDDVDDANLSADHSSHRHPLAKRPRLVFTDIQKRTLQVSFSLLITSWKKMVERAVKAVGKADCCFTKMFICCGVLRIRKTAVWKTTEICE